jgi:hypothetical protein
VIRPVTDHHDHPAALFDADRCYCCGDVVGMHLVGDPDGGDSPAFVAYAVADGRHVCGGCAWDAARYADTTGGAVTHDPF